MPKTSFSPLIAEGGNTFTRKWAGNADGKAVDPYITGYHFIKFKYIHETIGAYLQASQGDSGLSSKAEVASFLQSACLSVTLPGGTLNKAEFNGLGNTRYAVPSNVDFDNTTTIRFLEFSGLPVLTIFHNWVQMIRDYRTGTSGLNAESGTYTKSNYAASMLYWTTQPNGKFVEEYELLTGMFPMKDPRDQYGHDLTSIDKLEVDIDFNVDTMWHEKWVYDQCKTKAESYCTAGTNIAQGYGNADMGGAGSGTGE